jgi:hypothetical protein
MASAVVATGGSVTNIGVYTIHTFTNTTATTNFVVTEAGSVEILVVAGGGGGGATIGGGGGGGGVIYTNSFFLPAGTNAVVVGAGGAGGVVVGGAWPAGTNGGNSAFGSLIAYGGGGGASWTSKVGIAGGSGGGGAQGGAKGLAPYGQGNPAGTSGNSSAGGGGGAGSAGGNGNASIQSGSGGTGLAFNISGVLTNYAGGGGGGGGNSSVAGAGGPGGGGAGGALNSGRAGTNGVAGTGGGGGGGGYSSATSGGSGGSGIVIVRYDTVAPDINSVVASNVTYESVTLNATLSSTGAAPAYVSVYWGTNDAGVVASNWANASAFPGTRDPGPVATNISGLADRTFYYCRFAASNSFGETWSPVATFATLTDFSAWSRQVPLTFAGYNRSETLTNFPALVVLGSNVDGFSYGQFQSGLNADLVFSDAQGNELNYEIDQWDTNGLSYVWVQVPQLVDSNTAIRAFWGRTGWVAAAYTTNGAVWGGSYAGVWHLSEASGKRYDSAALLANGTPSGTITKVVGPIGSAERYFYTDGDDYVTITNSLARLENVQETNFTLEAWFKPMSTPPGSGSAIDANYGILMKNGNHEGLKYQPNNTFRFDHWLTGPTEAGVASVHAYAPGSFHHVVALLDRSVGRTAIYVDGVLEASNTFSAGSATLELNQNPWKLGIANPGAATYRWTCDGVVDEARISSVARSANWIWASWLGMASNGVLLTYGSVGLPTVRNETPTNITAGAANLNGYLVSTGLAPTTVRVYWGTNDGGTVEANWGITNDFGLRGPGPVTTNVSLSPGMLYFYRYYATNDYGDWWAAESLPVGAQEVNLIASDPNASEIGLDPGAFTVSRPDWATGAALTVYYTVGGTAANGADYSNLTGSVTIPVGATNAVITVTPLTDTEYFETNETVTVSLSTGAYIIGSANSATVTIENLQPSTVAVVSGTGSDVTGNGSFTNAYRSLTRALTNTPAYALIYVGTGTYTAAAGESFPLNLPAGTSLIGQGEPADAVIDVNSATNGLILNSTTGNDLIANLSLMRTKGTAITASGWQGCLSNVVISGVANGGAINNASVLNYNNAATRSLRFDRLMVTNVSCNVQKFLYFSGTGGALLFTNCTFRGLTTTVGSGQNSGNFHFGAIGFNTALADCLFESITVPSGTSYEGGMLLNGNTATTLFSLDRCVFRNITVTGAAGTMLYCPNRISSTSYARVRDCVFQNVNVGPTNGTFTGVIGGFRSNPGVRNCTFQNVTGVLRPNNDGNHAMYAYNCIVADCGRLGMRNPDYLYLYNVNVANTDVGAGYNVAGSTNVTALAPWFVDVGGSNLHLRSFSPLVDAGNSGYVQTSNDCDRIARIQDGDGNGTATVDLGAYESDFLSPAVPRFRTPLPVYNVNAGNVLEVPVWIQPPAAGAVTAAVTYGTDLSGAGTLSFASGSETGTLSITVASPLTVPDGTLLPVSISESGTAQGVATGDLGLYPYSSIVTVPGYEARAFIRAGETNQYAVQMPNETLTAGADITVTVGGVGGSGTNDIQWIGSNVITAGGWRTAGYLQVVGAGGENTITLSIGSGMTFAESGGINLTFDFVGYSSPLYVAPAGSDATGLGTEGSPWRSITFAETLVRQGDEILADPGLYSTNSGEVFPLTQVEGVTLRGVMGPLGDSTDSTVIDADGSGFNFFMGTLGSDPGNQGAGGLYDLVLTDALGTAIRARYWGGTISNCVIRNVVNGGAQDLTAVLRVENGARATALLNVTVTNVASSAGRILYFTGGSMATVRNCRFVNLTTTASNPIGVFEFRDHTVEITDSVFSDLAWPGANNDEGGMLLIYNNGGTVDRCLFRNLTVSSSADAIVCQNRATTIVRNSLFHNIASGASRPVIGNFRSTPQVRNCTFDGVSLVLRMSNGNTTDLAFFYNSSVSHSANLSLSTTNGPRLRLLNVNLYNTPGGSGYETNNSLNVTTNEPHYRDRAGGNYRLWLGSPMVDAGNTNYVQGVLDLGLTNRVMGFSVDLGAYEAIAVARGSVFRLR